MRDQIDVRKPAWWHKQVTTETWASLKATYRVLVPANGTSGQLTGLIDVKVTKPFARAICVDSKVRDFPGREAVELMSTYVGYAGVGCESEMRWRAIHLDILPGDDELNDARSARVRPYRPLEGMADVRLCILDHLYEFADSLSGVLVGPVAIEI